MENYEKWRIFAVKVQGMKVFGNLGIRVSQIFTYFIVYFHLFPLENIETVIGYYL